MKRKSMRKHSKRHSVSTAKVAKDMKKAEYRKRYFTKEDQLSRIQKYEEADKKNKYFKPFQGDPSFRGPKRILDFDVFFLTITSKEKSYR